MSLIQLFNLLIENHIFPLKIPDVKLFIPRFTKKSWMAFAALRGAYKHVQVSFNLLFPRVLRTKNRRIRLVCLSKVVHGKKIIGI